MSFKKTKEELQKLLEEMQDYFESYFPNLYALETNLDKIFELVLEKEKNTASYPNMSDDQIRETIKDELDEVKEYTFAMTEKLRKMATMFKIKFDEKKIILEEKKDIIALLEQSNRLSDEMFTDKILELEALQTDFEDYNQNQPVLFITNLLNHLNNLIESVSDLESVLEDHIGFEIEDMNERFERFQIEKGIDFEL